MLERYLKLKDTINTCFQIDLKNKPVEHITADEENNG